MKVIYNVEKLWIDDLYTVEFWNAAISKYREVDFEEVESIEEE